jgi:competence protein ComEA
MVKFSHEIAKQFVALPLASWIVIGVLVLGGLLLTGFGMWQLMSGGDEVAAVQSEAVVLQVCDSPEEKSITVDVSGAVVVPGVYVVLQGDRIADVVAAAGGLSDLADAVLVSRQLNLATVLTDGQKVHIPLKGEQELSTVVSSAAKDSTTSTGLISINSASQSMLEELTGIGEKRAQDIIAGRPYAQVEELVEREILTAAQFEKMKAEVQL